MTTLSEWLRAQTRLFERAGVPSPRVDAELLAMHVLRLDRTELTLRGGTELPPGAAAELSALARRREAREPVQHLLGEVEWGDLTLKVTPEALVPRPETEVLLQLALDAAQSMPAPRVLDVGTGTGALALAFKRARPDARVWASDLSPGALRLARENAARLGLDVTFAEGDLHAGLPGPFELVVSNPPYLPAADAQRAPPEVRRDPPLALYAGPDGLAVARQLARVARDLLVPGGLLALELDPRNAGRLAGELVHWEVTLWPDLSGRERFVLARLA